MSDKLPLDSQEFACGGGINTVREGGGGPGGEFFS